MCNEEGQIGFLERFTQNECGDNKGTHEIGYPGRSGYLSHHVFYKKLLEYKGQLMIVSKKRGYVKTGKIRLPFVSFQMPESSSVF